MSGRKNILSPYHAITSGDMSGDLTSPPSNIQYLDNVSIQFIFTGTPSGTFYVQGSLDNQNWSNLSFSPAPQATGASGTVLIDLNQLSFPYVRATYVHTSGAGSLDMWISGKQV